MARLSKNRGETLRGHPIPLNAPPPARSATRVVWSDGPARVATELTPQQAAALFQRWEIDAETSERLCGAPFRTDLYSDEPPPSLEELLRRLERHKLVEPNTTWWGRAFERLVQRFGEDLIILAACGLIAAFFFARTIWSFWVAAAGA